MVSRLRLLAVVTFAISAAACGGGDDGDTLTEQEATQAFTSMEGALSEIGAELESTGTTGNVNVSVSCENGGTAEADGQWTSGESFSLDLTFDGCVAENITIDGGLSYRGSATSGGATVTMDGRLTFAGAVNGTCRVDLTLTLTETSFHLRGSMCGVSVDSNIQT